MRSVSYLAVFPMLGTMEDIFQWAFKFVNSSALFVISEHTEEFLGAVGEHVRVHIRQRGHGEHWGGSGLARCLQLLQLDCLGAHRLQVDTLEFRQLANI